MLSNNQQLGNGSLSNPASFIDQSVVSPSFTSTPLGVDNLRAEINPTTLVASVPTSAVVDAVVTNPTTLDLQRATLERIFHSSPSAVNVAEATIGNVALNGASRFALRLAGGIAGAIVTEAVFAESTASELHDTTAGVLYSYSGIERARNGSPEQRQVSILTLANDNAIGKLVGYPRVLQRLTDSEWNSIITVNNTIEKASENFPGQQFDVKQFHLEDGSTLLALQRGRTIIPLMRDDTPMSYQVLQLPAPQQPNMAASATLNQGENITALYNQASEQYNAAWKTFQESDFGPDALSTLQRGLNQVQLVSDRPEVPDFYTGQDRERELAIAR